MLRVTLDDLLRHLDVPGVLVVCGDPQAFVVRSVAQWRTGAVPPRDAWTMVDGTTALEAVSRAGPRAVLASSRVVDAAPSACAALEAAGAVVIAWPDAIPLDLSARVQAWIHANDADVPGDALLRARQDLVEDLVLGRYRDVDANVRRGRSLGVFLDALHAVIVVGFVDFERFYLRHEERGEAYFQRLKNAILATTRRVVGQHQTRATVVPHGEGAIALLERADDGVGLALAEALRSEVRFVPLVVAAGSEIEGSDRWARSYDEAMAALRLRARLQLRERFVAFRDVTEFALLERVAAVPAIASMLEAELAPLLDGEYGRKPILVETLAAYYDGGSSLKAAAEALGIHPKTLRYRLDRIDEVLGPGTIAGEKRLLLHLAARVHLWLRR